eukprot:1149402-Pelagomonas_calceolata.AAC.7
MAPAHVEEGAGPLHGTRQQSLHAAVGAVAPWHVHHPAVVAAAAAAAPPKQQLHLPAPAPCVHAGRLANRPTCMHARARMCVYVCVCARVRARECENSSNCSTNGKCLCNHRPKNGSRAQMVPVTDVSNG